MRVPRAIRVPVVVLAVTAIVAVAGQAGADSTPVGSCGHIVLTQVHVQPLGIGVSVVMDPGAP